MAGSPTQGSPMTWTIRFKQQKSTTILHVDPLQSLDSIKEELLRALKQTHRTGSINGATIPSSISDVFLARPNDTYDLDKGWTSLLDREGNIITGNEPVAKKRKIDGAELRVGDQCPKAAGLKDGAIVAYKFRTEDGDEDEGLSLSDEQWDVTMPSYDETVEGTG